MAKLSARSFKSWLEADRIFNKLANKYVFENNEMIVTNICIEKNVLKVDITCSSLTESTIAKPEFVSYINDCLSKRIQIKDIVKNITGIRVIL